MEIREIVRALPQWTADKLRSDPVDSQMLLLAYLGDNLIGRMVVACDSLDTIANNDRATPGLNFKGLCYTSTFNRSGTYTPYICDHCKFGKSEGWLLFLNQTKFSLCNGCVFDQ
jgi:hypothetical protein